MTLCMSKYFVLTLTLILITKVSNKLAYATNISGNVFQKLIK